MKRGDGESLPRQSLDGCPPEAHVAVAQTGDEALDAHVCRP